MTRNDKLKFFTSIENYKPVKAILNKNTVYLNVFEEPVSGFKKACEFTIYINSTLKTSECNKLRNSLKRQLKNFIQ